MRLLRIPSTYGRTIIATESVNTYYSNEQILDTQLPTIPTYTACTTTRYIVQSTYMYKCQEHVER